MTRTILANRLATAILSGAFALGAAACGESESTDQLIEAADDADIAGDVNQNRWVHVTWAGKKHEFTLPNDAVQLCYTGFKEMEMSFVTAQIPNGPEFHITSTRGLNSYVATLNRTEASVDNKVNYDDNAKTISGTVTFESGIVEFEMSC